MKSDTLLDHAVFQLSPKRSRCELFVHGNGKTDKLASGFVMPFVTHLKAIEEPMALSVQAIKLEVEECRNSETWFTKGTLERFVRFVSTPEILELVNILDIEMSQLEATQKLYSQGAGDQLPGTGGSGYGVRAASDKTKKELLRVIDMRLSAVKQDLAMALSRAESAGFDLVTVSELQMFADQFSAHRLNEACLKFLSLLERRADLTKSWKDGIDERDILSSSGSDMSVDADPTTKKRLYARFDQLRGSRSVNGRHSAETTMSSIVQKAKNSSMSSQVCRSRGSGLEKEDMCKNDKPVASKEIKESRLSGRVNSVPSGQLVRRLSMRDRINAFEIKKVPSGRVGKPVTGESAKIRRQSSQDKAVLRKWRSTSDMRRDSIGDKTDTENSICTPSSATACRDKSEDKKRLSSSGSASYGKPVCKAVPGRAFDGELKDQVQMQSTVRSTGSEEEISGLKPLTYSTSMLADASVGTQMVVNPSTVEYVARRNQNQWDPKGKLDMNWGNHAMGQTNSDGDSALKTKFERVVSDSEQVKRFIGYRSESDGNSAPKTNFERTVSDPELVKRFIGSKGNLELNNKLKLKADELEKLFAEHKLRVNGESSFTRRSLSCRPFMELVENHSDASSDNSSDFTREKYYNTYLQRRNEKLRDEWSSRREEKEAKLKAMHDSFERSSAEMKANFSGTRKLAEYFESFRGSSYIGKEQVES